MRDDCLNTDSARPSQCAGRLLVLANCLAILVVALGLRLWRLDNIPGVNGDEAQYGVHAMSWLRGEPIPLRTNTGNPLNVFFYGPQIALHAIAPPSFALLRSVAAASGILALALNYLLAWRLLGIRFAVVSTLLLAVLPIDIAYSRFAWDACQSLPATLLVIYGSLGAVVEPDRRGRWLALAVVASATAALIHPTNIFVVPFVGLALLSNQRNELARRVGWNRGQGRRIAICSTLAVVAVGGAVAVRYVGHIGTGQFPTIGEALAFARNYERLFTGVTVYRYIPGSQLEESARISGLPWDVGLYDVAAIVVVVLCVVMWRSIPLEDVSGAEREGSALEGDRHLLPTTARPRCPKTSQSPGDASGAADWFLLWGCAATTAAFFLVAGPRAIEPHWERYGIVLIAPGALLLTRSLERVRFATPRTARLATATGLAGAWLMLAGFYLNYFAYFAETGGRSHRAFRTAAVEPKQAALVYILSKREADEPVWIVASDWWSYWPLRYLAEGRRNVHVYRPAEVEAASVEEALAAGDVWIVEFVDDAVPTAEGLASQHFVSDFSGRSLLRLSRLRSWPPEGRREAWTAAQHQPKRLGTSESNRSPVGWHRRLPRERLPSAVSVDLCGFLERFPKAPGLTSNKVDLGFFTEVGMQDARLAGTTPSRAFLRGIPFSWYSPC